MFSGLIIPELKKIATKKGKLGYEPKYRDSIFTHPQFDFYFKIALPKARKEREILLRDYLGRIVTSRVPEVKTSYV